MCFTGVVDYLISDRKIICFDPNGRRSQREELLLGPVFAYWLELHRRYPVLHAATVHVGGRTVGIVGSSGSGKSTLSTALVRSGATLISDDLLPIHMESGQVLTCAGKRRIRLCQDAFRYFHCDGAGLRPIVDPVAQPDGKIAVTVGDAFDVAGEDWFELNGLYMLHPEHAALNQRAKLEPCSFQDALIALVAQSYMPRITGALGLERERLQTLSEVVQCVPVRRLHVPRLFPSLESARKLISDDLLN